MSTKISSLSNRIKDALNFDDHSDIRKKLLSIIKKKIKNFMIMAKGISTKVVIK